jgi:hypothetical protein
MGICDFIEYSGVSSRISPDLRGLKVQITLQHHGRRGRIDL